MKKKLLAVLMTGIMAMSFAATTTAVYAKGDDDNTLTVWAWDQNFNIKAMNIAGEQYAKDHEGFKVDVVETSSDDCQTRLQHTSGHRSDAGQQLSEISEELSGCFYRSEGYGYQLG